MFIAHCYVFFKWQIMHKHTSQLCQQHRSRSGSSGRLLRFAESNWHVGKSFLALSDAPMLFSRVWKAWKYMCRCSSINVWKFCSSPQSLQQHSSTATQMSFWFWVHSAFIYIYLLLFLFLIFCTTTTTTAVFAYLCNVLLPSDLNIFKASYTYAETLSVLYK